MHWVDGSFRFWSRQAGKGRPKHASIPKWHFAMMTDEHRNGAYEKAICKAVKLHSTLAAEPNDVHALDIGAGSGLLSMFAARQGFLCLLKLRERCIDLS